MSTVSQGINPHPVALALGDTLANTPNEMPPRSLTCRGRGHYLRGGNDMSKPTCSMNGCEKVNHARGLCMAHYRRWRLYGDASLMKRRQYPKRGVEGCTIDGCTFMVCARGWCSKHYANFLRWGDPLLDGPTVPSAARRCDVEGCERLVFRSPSVSSQCDFHRRRLARTGTFDDPPSRRERGWLNTHGYRFVSVEGRSVLEHRWVMEQVMGRRLLPTETVHHLNGVRSDNRVENLELWIKAQPPGVRVKDAVVWAREVLVRYGEMYPE